jgi:hypothetical protein
VTSGKVINLVVPADHWSVLTGESLAQISDDVAGVLGTR